MYKKIVSFLLSLSVLGSTAFGVTQYGKLKPFDISSLCTTYDWEAGDLGILPQPPTVDLQMTPVENRSYLTGITYGEFINKVDDMFGNGDSLAYVSGDSMMTEDDIIFAGDTTNPWFYRWLEGLLRFKIYVVCVHPDYIDKEVEFSDEFMCEEDIALTDWIVTKVVFDGEARRQNTKSQDIDMIEDMELYYDSGLKNEDEIVKGYYNTIENIMSLAYKKYSLEKIKDDVNDMIYTICFKDIVDNNHQIRKAPDYRYGANTIYTYRIGKTIFS